MAARKAVARRAAAAVAAAAAAPTNSSPASLATPAQPRGFLIRESTQYDAGLLVGMVSKVLSDAVIAGSTHLQAMIDAAEELVMRGPQGDAARALFAGTDIVTPSGAWVGWELVSGTDRVLICPASAAEAVGEAEENAFTEGVIAWVRRTRPCEVVTGPFSRMGRRMRYLSKVRAALSRYQVLFRCQDSPVLKPNDPFGDMAWNLLAMTSESDWLNTIERNYTGRVWAVKKGRWPFADAALPLGYRKTAEGSKVEVNPDEVDLVAKMLTAAAQESDPAALLRRWDELGVPRMRRQNRDKDLGKTVGSLQTAPRGVVDRRLRWLEVYETGDYRMRLENPLPAGYKVHIHGVDVVGTTPEVPEYAGRVELSVTFGLPTRRLGGKAVRGFVAPEVLEQVRRRWAPRECGECTVCLTGSDEACLNDGVAPAGREGGRPFAGLPGWSDHQFEYRLLSNHGDYYSLHRRALAHLGTSWALVPGEALGRIRGADMDGAVGQALLAARFGRVHAAGTALLSVEEAAAIREQIVEGRATSGAARAEAATLEQVAQTVDGDQRTVLLTLAEQKLAAAAAADRLSAELEAQLRSEVEVDADQVEVETGGLPEVTALLVRGHRTWPAEATRTLARLLAGSLRVTASPLMMTVSFSIRLPAAGGAGYVTTSSLDVQVPNRLYADAGRPTLAKRVDTALEEFMTGTESLQQFADRAGWAEGTVRNNVGAALSRMLPAGSPARGALLDAPVPFPRWVVWQQLTGQVPDGLAAALADGRVSEQTQALLAMTYLDPKMRWAGAWAMGTHQSRRAVLGYLRAHREAFEYAGPGECELRELELGSGVGGAELANIRNPRGTSRYPHVLRATQVGNRWRPTLLAALRCPHCEREGAATATKGWADHVLRVPEVWDAVICPDCRRMPSRAEVFPVEYLKAWAGPWGRNDGRWAGTSEVSLSLPAPRHRVLEQLRLEAAS